MVHRRVDHMEVVKEPVVVNGTSGCGIHQMVIHIDQTVQIRNHQEIGIAPTKTRAPTCKKFVKRREKIETTKHHLGTNIQVKFQNFI